MWVGRHVVHWKVAMKQNELRRTFVGFEKTLTHADAVSTRVAKVLSVRWFLLCAAIPTAKNLIIDGPL